MLSKEEKKNLRNLYAKELFETFTDSIKEYQQYALEKYDEAKADCPGLPQFAGVVPRMSNSENGLPLLLDTYFVYIGRVARKSLCLLREADIPIPDEGEPEFCVKVFLDKRFDFLLGHIFRCVPRKDADRGRRSRFFDVVAKAKGCTGDPITSMPEVLDWAQETVEELARKTEHKIQTFIKEKTAASVRELRPHADCQAVALEGLCVELLPKNVMHIVEMRAYFQDAWGNRKILKHSCQLNLNHCLWMRREEAIAYIQEALATFSSESVPIFLSQVPLLIRRLDTYDWARQLIDRCRGGYPHISVVFSGFPATNTMAYSFLEPRGEGVYHETLVLGSPLNMGSVFPLGDQRYPLRGPGNSNPYSIYAETRLPRDALEVDRFCAEFEALYTNADFQGCPKPKLRLWCSFRENTLEIEPFPNCLISLSSGQKPISDHALEAIEKIFAAVYAEQRKQQAASEKLSALNKAELQILRLLTGRKMTFSRSEIIRAVTGVTNSGVDYYLDILRGCGLVIRKELRGQWESKGYSLAQKVDRADILSAQPVPFMEHDLPYLDRDEGRNALPEILASLSTQDGRWRGLRLLEQMPKAYAASYAKTDAGKAFFSQFAGDDAAYARLFLDGLPGCKRIAQKLFQED